MTEMAPLHRVNAGGRTVGATIMPGLFVVFWSTGFICAKLGLPYAEPLTFLAVRFYIVMALLLPASLLLRVSWPGSWSEVRHIIVAGLLVHGVFLGGVFTSIYYGLEAGVVALVVGIQPLLTAALAVAFLKVAISRQQWCGLFVGLAGVTLVVWHKLALGLGTLIGMELAVMALISITIGTLYQKRFCANMNLISGNTIQFAASCVVLTGLAFLLESTEIDWSPQFVFSMTWLVLVLSIGAITLLYVLLRRSGAVEVASLFYLVPPATALIAWALLDESLGVVMLIGMGLAILGMVLINVKRWDLNLLPLSLSRTSDGDVPVDVEKLR